MPYLALRLIESGLVSLIESSLVLRVCERPACCARAYLLSSLICLTMHLPANHALGGMAMYKKAVGPLRATQQLAAQTGMWGTSTREYAVSSVMSA